MGKHRAEKKAALGVIPVRKKRPAVASEQSLYSDKKAAWRLGKVQISHPYGWHTISASDVVKLREKLGHFEKSTWNELFVTNADYNHRIQADQLKCPIARQWMKDNLRDQPFLWTLRISAKERIWGILSEDAYQVIFWDPNHLIWEISRN